MENEKTPMHGPLVSIGVPVYNDAPWLRNSLDHILAQEYSNLEIIIADDGSTDGSREICREYAKRDTRIRLIENKHNLGAYLNHKFVFDISTGDYFVWGSGHDYLHPVFVSRLIENLQANDSVVMSCSQSVFVRENGEVLRTAKGGLDTRRLPPVERFRKLLAHLVGGGTANIFFGLYRHDVLGRVDLARNVLGTDVVMLGELSLLGEMTQVDEVLYYRLVNVEDPKDLAKKHVENLTVHGAHNVNVLIPHVAMLYEYLCVIEGGQLSPAEKQSLNEQVFQEGQRIKKIIATELNQFVVTARAELLSLKSYPLVRRYRAAQILSALEQTLLFDFECEGLHQVRSLCLAEMGLDTEARVAELKEIKVRFKQNTWQTLNYYRFRLTDRLRRFFKRER